MTIKKHRFKTGQKFGFFQRGYTMVFVQKLTLFPPFVLMQNRAVKRIGEVPERMEVFLDNKKNH